MAAVPVTAILRRVALTLCSHAHTQVLTSFPTATPKHLKPVRLRPGGFTPTGTDFTKPRPSSPPPNVVSKNCTKTPPLFSSDPIRAPNTLHLPPSPSARPRQAPPPGR